MPAKSAKLVDRAHQAVKRMVHFGREYTAGLTTSDLERMFDDETINAFTVLAGDPARKTDTKDEIELFFIQLKAFFLGLAFKLSPARRLLFAISMVAPLIGLIGGFTTISFRSIVLDFSPFWFLISISGFFLLLTLELVDRLRVRDELDVARELQRDLLPQETPRMPGYSIAHSYRTANEIGGDYYDFLPLDDGRMVLAVGDASGHGIGAGLLMAIANASMRTAIDIDPKPSAVLELLNGTLRKTGGHRAFMTMFYAILDPSSGEMVYACAGHPFPLIRQADGTLVELGEGALPLGLKKKGEYRCATVSLRAGETLVLYSDGLPEATGGPDETPFTFERLRHLLSIPGNAQTVHDRILTDVERHLGHRHINDDLTLVVISHDDDVTLPPLPSA